MGELFDIYLLKFCAPDSCESNLRKEFDLMMKLKWEFMPYWFVCEVLSLGIDINEYDELF